MKIFVHTSLLIVSFSFFVSSALSQSEFNTVTKTLLLMEEEVQTANTVEADRGNAHFSDVRSEVLSTKGSDQSSKRQKLTIVLESMDKINTSTNRIITFLDELKKRYIVSSGIENKQAFQSLTINPIKDSRPTRIPLFDLKKPLNKISVTDAEVQQIKSELELYRKLLIQAVGTYQLREKYVTNDVEFIQENLNYSDLVERVFNEMNKDNTMNYIEDKYVLIDLYINLRNAYLYVDLLESGALITNVSILSALQHHVLSSRALALAHWKSKVSTGQYYFDTIEPIVVGPTSISSTEKVELVGMMVAFNSENQPNIVVTSHPDATVRYDGDGKGRIQLGQLPVGEHTIEGTLSVKDKTGLPITKAWTATVLVVE